MGESRCASRCTGDGDDKMRMPPIDYFVKYDSLSRTFRVLAWKRSILPGWMGFDPNITSGLLTVPTQGITTYFRQFCASQSNQMADLFTPMECRNLMFEDSSGGASDFTLQFTDVSDGRVLQNAPVHILTIAGNAQLPAVLREPLWMRSSYGLRCVATKISGTTPTVRIAFGGALYYPWGPDLDRDLDGAAEMRRVIEAWNERRKYVAPFFLTPDAPNNPIVLTASQNKQVEIKVGDDGHFEAFALTMYNGGVNYSYSLMEARSKTYLSNGQIDGAAGIGSAQYPTLLPVPYLIPSGSKLVLNITDGGSGGTYWFTIQGRKIWAPLKNVGDVLNDTTVRTGMEMAPVETPRPMIIGV